MSEWEHETSERIWHKLVAVASGDQSLALRALTAADPENLTPRLEKVVEYITKCRTGRLAHGADRQIPEGKQE